MLLPDIYIIILAVLVDLIIGDPRHLPHPVQAIGWLITVLEPVFRKTIQNLKIAGLLMSVLIVGLITVFVLLISILGFIISPTVGIVVQIVLITSGLAVNSLAREGWMVRRFLKLNQTDKARARVQQIVSRDLSKEDRAGITRALIETMTENLSDGVIAPLIFAALGGATGIWFYKTVNTLDSMIGYKNERYRQFGWFAARLDDVVNYLPARLTGLLIFMTSALLLRKPLSAIKAWIRDAQKGPSPNGGIPIVTFAGAIDIRLGGNCYDHSGKLIPIPKVGGRRDKLKTQDISWALAFHYCTTAILLASLFVAGQIF